MNEFFKTLLSLTVGGSILAALLLGLKALLGKKLPSVFYYYAWLVVLLRFLLPIPGIAHYERVVPESAQPTLAAWDSETLRPVAAYQSPTVHQADVTGMMPQAAPEETPLELPSEVPSEASFGQVPVAAQQPIHEPTVPAQPRKAPALSLTLTPAQWILIIWAGGAAASMLFFLLSYGRFIRALNKTLRRPNLRDLEIYRDLDGPRRLRLLRSCGVNTPMQLGLFRPKLVLPEREYTNGMLESILRHELTHYNRHDILYKWFALTVCCLHWFNPLLWIIRRELDRDCELSCDERLLKSMSVQEKRSYGETLLALASDRALSRRVIATSFATEKRNLKERLEQIMTYQHMGKATVALTMCLCVLLGCFAVAAGPAQAAQTPESDVPTETVNPPELTEQPSALESVTVSTVDEFLAAIAPGANIVLKDGDYNLTRASNYPRKSENERWEEITEGKVTQGSDYYHWAPCYDGYSLSISGVNNLTIQGEEGASVQIITSPRYADVLHFEGCQDINLRNLTVGHTIEKGSCTGGVLDFEGTANVVVDGCALYGCGTWGVYARYCRQMQVIGSRIYDCSEGAVQLGGCQDIQVNSCEIYECTASFGGLLKVWQSEQIAFTNSHIYNNTDVQFLIEAYDGSQGVYMGGLLVENNEFKNALYTCTQAPITFSHCEIRESNTLPGSYMGRNEGNLNYLAAVSPEGEQLSDNDADFHSRGTVIWAADMKKPAPEAVEPDADGMIHVSTVDEFVAAIGPDRTVYLEPGDYDLTTASDYGKLGGYYYTWNEEFDGYSLALQNIKGLTIAGAGVDQVNIVTVPRYADVLLLQNCEDVTLRDFTAGHTIEPGYCAGDVLQMENCRRIEVSGCSLFGCGVYGVNGYYCDNLKVENTEIHHCSQGVALLFGCTNVSFIGCDIHDNFYEYEVDGKIVRFDANEICTNQGNYPAESGKDYFF